MVFGISRAEKIVKHKAKSDTAKERVKSPEYVADKKKLQEKRGTMTEEEFQAERAALRDKHKVNDANGNPGYFKSSAYVKGKKDIQNSGGWMNSGWGMATTTILPTALMMGIPYLMSSGEEKPPEEEAPADTTGYDSGYESGAEQPPATTYQPASNYPVQYTA